MLFDVNLANLECIFTQNKTLICNNSFQITCGGNNFCYI